MTTEKNVSAIAGERRRTGVIALVFAAVGPGLVWAGYLALMYPFAHTACTTGVLIPMHAASVVAAAAILCLTWRGWRRWHSAQHAEPWDATAESGDDPGPAELQRARFLGLVSLASGAFFLMVVLATWVAAFVFHPCQQA